MRVVKTGESKKNEILSRNPFLVASHLPDFKKLKKALTSSGASFIVATNNNRDRSMSQKTFTTTEVRKVLDLNRNTFQVWVDQRFIKPDIQKSTRQGESNIFSLDNLYQIHLFNVLLQMGIHRQVAKEVQNLSFENVGSGEGQLKYAVCKRGRVKGLKLGKATQWSLHQGAPRVALVGDGDIAFVVDVLAIKNEVDELKAEHL